MKGKGYPNLSKIDDIHVICSVLKDFLRNLKEPLLTYTLHGAFTLAADMENDEEALAQCLQAIAQLPTANKDTLAFIILHIKTVAYHSKENKNDIGKSSQGLWPNCGRTLISRTRSSSDLA